MHPAVGCFAAVSARVGVGLLIRCVQLSDAVEAGVSMLTCYSQQ